MDNSNLDDPGLARNEHSKTPWTKPLAKAEVGAKVFEIVLWESGAEVIIVVVVVVVVLNAVRLHCAAFQAGIDKSLGSHLDPAPLHCVFCHSIPRLSSIRFWTVGTLRILSPQIVLCTEAWSVIENVQQCNIYTPLLQPRNTNYKD
jgi:hypothetical protein